MGCITFHLLTWNEVICIYLSYYLNRKRRKRTVDNFGNLLLGLSHDMFSFEYSAFFFLSGCNSCYLILIWSQMNFKLYL